MTATGGDGGAGIGGGKGGAAENITITGSTVTATGGSALGFGGAGIGGGSDGRNSGSNGKNITITGSTVTAKGGNGSAGIGGGVTGIGEAITITGSTVTATGGIGAAGIGGGCGGDNGNGENITITGSRVTATGNSGGAGIGGGERCDGENITITGSTVTATGDRGGAGIGGGAGESNRGNGNGNNITITGSTVTAISNGCGQRGNGGGAGIGGGCNRNGSHITINGGTVTAEGGDHGAGIGGGAKGSGSNVTVSGAAQVTAIAGKGDRWDGAGATIGSGSGGSTSNPDGTFTPGSGQEIQANISGLITGWIHHIIYDPALVSEDNPDGILKEWWEPERPQPNPEDPNAPAEESNEVSLGTPGLHVETLEGDLLPFDARQQGGTLRVTSNTLAARLHGTRQALEALQEQGVEQIVFVTTLKTTTLFCGRAAGRGGQLVCPGAQRPWEPAAERSSGREPEVPDALKNTDPLQGPPWGTTRGGLFLLYNRYKARPRGHTGVGGVFPRKKLPPDCAFCTENRPGDETEQIKRKSAFFRKNTCQMHEDVIEYLSAAKGLCDTSRAGQRYA